MDKFFYTFLCLLLVCCLCVGSLYFFENRELKDEKQVISFSLPGWLEAVSSIEFPRWNVATLTALSSDMDTMMSYDEVANFIKENSGFVTRLIVLGQLKSSYNEYIFNGNVTPIEFQGYSFTPSGYSTDPTVDHDGVLFKAEVDENMDPTSNVFTFFARLARFVGSMFSTFWKLCKVIWPFNYHETINVPYSMV